MCFWIEIDSEKITNTFESRAAPASKFVDITPQRRSPLRCLSLLHVDSLASGFLSHAGDSSELAPLLALPGEKPRERGAGRQSAHPALEGHVDCIPG
jgi:hypothetical protein